MKRGTIRQIPLQADLCLNTQKVDIADFKGWQDCNAPVYGDCLSPLYKKENSHHDIFIGDDTYDFSNGVLSKNGTEVLSGAGSKKIKKTKLTDKYDAIAVSGDGVLTWVRITSGNSYIYALHGEERSATLEHSERIVAVKAFCIDDTYGTVVWYLNDSGNYQYQVKWIEDGTLYSKEGEGNTAQVWTDIEVVSPLIQVAPFNADNILISFFGTSGAEIPSTQVKNIFLKEGALYSDPTFHDGTLYDQLYGVKTDQMEVAVKIDTKFASKDSDETQNTTYPCVQYGVEQTVRIYVANNRMPIAIDFHTQFADVIETIEFPANYNGWYTRKVAYWGYAESTEVEITNPNYRYENSETGTVLTGTGLVSPPVGDLSQADYIKILPAFTTRISPFQMRASNTQQTFFSLSYNVRYMGLSNVNDTLPPSYTEEITVDNESSLAGLAISNSNYYRTGTSVASPENWTYSELQSLLSASEPVTNRRDPYDSAWLYDLCFALSPYNVVSFPIYYGSFVRNEGNSYSNYNFDNGTQTIDYLYKEAFINNALKEVDCCMDNGKLYCVGALTSSPDTPLPTKKLALAGEFTSFDSVEKRIDYVSLATLDIAYDYDEETNIYPKYYAGMTISLQNHYLRLVYLFKAKAEDTEYINILVDSLTAGEGGKASFLYAGVLNGKNTNLQGGVENTSDTEGWRLLFNNGMLSNIACYENKDYIGTILADWFVPDTEFCVAYTDNVLYYRDNANTIWKLEMVDSGEDWSYKFVENRFIVLNTTNYFNCYDTETGVKRHWASDYNNRVMFGYGFSEYSNNETFGELLATETFTGLLITGQNANYEMTNDPITSIELGALLYTKCLAEFLTFISCNTPYGAVEGIDVYKADEGSTSALYSASYINKIKYIDTDLTNPYAVYPIAEDGDIRYNPNLFTEFITSYNNKDMVIADGIAYKLTYFNNVTPIMAYFLLDGVENLENAFVLQSSYYGVAKTRLYQMNYTDGVGVEVVADITNLEYLGALPTQALFWSAQNRAIYSFTGSCIMQLTQYANELTDIYGKWYNPATQELFLDTNIGLLVFSDLGTYALKDLAESRIRDIFFFEDCFVINVIGDSGYSYYYSYNLKDGYISNKIKFLTKYFGNGLVPITVNNIYIRLYNMSEVGGAEGTLKLKGYTITDIGTTTDEKTIEIGGETGEQWDSATHTMLVKYTPQYNKGMGFALELEGTFPIVDIRFDYVENGSVEGQLGHINV